MNLELKGKRALVTGSSSGLGAATALELAAEGVNLVVHGRDRERAEAVAREAASLGVEVALAIGDLMQDDDLERVTDVALKRFGGIDILVNNAGVAMQPHNPPWTEVPTQVWLDSFRLNLCADVYLSQRLSPGMIERGWGRIINISSLAGSQANGRLMDYGAAKAAVDHFTANLSKLLAPHGVTVNAIVPGAILTPVLERWLGTLRAQKGWPNDFADNERRYMTEVSPQPVPRLGRPREIAAAVAWLASPLSGYTTGACLRIDGGATTAA